MTSVRPDAEHDQSGSHRNGEPRDEVDDHLDADQVVLKVKREKKKGKGRTKAPGDRETARRLKEQIEEALKMLREGANVLLLDEPTNDLDVNTLRALEEALENFGGCAVVISHDRWFLDRLATHILAFEGDSQVVFFQGNWSEYDADRKQRLGADAAVPKRIRYRQLTR